MCLCDSWVTTCEVIQTFRPSHLISPSPLSLSLHPPPFTLSFTPFPVRLSVSVSPLFPVLCFKAEACVTHSTWRMKPLSCLEVAAPAAAAAAAAANGASREGRRRREEEWCECVCVDVGGGCQEWSFFCSFTVIKKKKKNKPNGWSYSSCMHLDPS